MGSAGRSLILEHVWTTKIYAVGHGVATQGLVIQAERVANLVDRYPAFFRAVSHPFREHEVHGIVQAGAPERRDADDAGWKACL